MKRTQLYVSLNVDMQGNVPEKNESTNVLKKFIVPFIYH